MKYVSTSNLCDFLAEWGTAIIEDMTHSKQLTCFPRKNLRVNKIEEKLLIQTLMLSFVRSALDCRSYTQQKKERNEKYGFSSFHSDCSEKKEREQADYSMCNTHALART